MTFIFYKLPELGAVRLRAVWKDNRDGDAGGSNMSAFAVLYSFISVSMDTNLKR